MGLNKAQTVLVSSGIAIYFVMYFGCETKAKNIRDLEKSRQLNMEVTSIDNLIIEAKKLLSPDQISMVETMTSQLGVDTIRKIENLKLLAKTWFEYDNPVISGYYAEEISNIVNTPETWSIAGTTYIFGIKNAKDEKSKEFSKQRAIRAIEKAVSMEPENINHKINLALCYVEKPDQDNAMKGILMLRELNTKYPKNVAVLNQLARLALKTNQIDRAIQRLKEAIVIEPDNQTTICLFAEAYEKAGDAANQKVFSDKCKI
jgi:tetratricopeptide (TPR) repeat protein